MERDKKKIALFDFCETLVDFQTADAFVRFVAERNMGNKRMRTIRNIHYVLSRLKVFSIIFRIKPTWMAGKRLLLLQLKGMTTEDLNRLADEFYEQKLEPHFIPPVHKYLRQLQDEGYRIVIVSGGYDIYLKVFCKHFNIKDIICTKISFTNEICDGTIDGLDCLLDNKIIMLESYLGRNNDTKQWYAFSDSYTDLPLLKYVGNPYGVKRILENKPWIDENNIKLIEY